MIVDHHSSVTLDWSDALIWSLQLISLRSAPCVLFLFAENTWEPAKDTHCRELIHKFHCDNQEKLKLQIDKAVERVRCGLATMTQRQHLFRASALRCY